MFALPLLLTSVALSAGGLDPTFGDDGRVLTQLGGGDSVLHSVVAETDGSLLAAGGIHDGASVVSYQANGAIDTSFANQGWLDLQCTGGLRDGSAINLQTTGAAILAGYEIPSFEGSYIARVTGVQSCEDTHFVYGPFYVPTKLLRRPDDGMVMVGYTAGNLFVTQTDAALAHLSGFGNQGTVETDLGGEEQATDVILQSSGRLVVGGWTDKRGTEDFVLVGYRGDGSVDTTFGNRGLAYTDFGSGQDRLIGLAQQRDGKMVAAGVSRLGSSDVALARYNIDGSPDNTFGTNGKVVTNLGGITDEGRALQIRSNGQIVVAGSTDVGGRKDFFMVAYLPDGHLDTSFGNRGVLLIDFGRTRDDELREIAAQPGGKIIVAGTSTQVKKPFTASFALARYSPTVAADTRPRCRGVLATIVGTNSSETLRGTAGEDVIVGLGGNDIINGLGGNDVICGGAGNDTLNGGEGNDTLLGDTGNDKLVGSAGLDNLEGNAGVDTLNGGAGQDNCRGSGGTDTLSACEVLSTRQ